MLLYTSVPSRDKVECNAHAVAAASCAPSTPLQRVHENARSQLIRDSLPFKLRGLETALTSELTRATFCDGFYKSLGSTITAINSLTSGVSCTVLSLKLLNFCNEFAMCWGVRQTFTGREVKVFSLAYNLCF